MIGYDRYSAQYLVQDLKAYGNQVDDVFQGENLWPVIQEAEGLLKDGRINIGDNDLLKAHLLNCALKMNNQRGRGKIEKINATLHIDGAAALLDALTVRQKWWSQIGEQLQNKREGRTMGLFQKIFGKRPEPKGEYQGQWRLLGGAEPKWRAAGSDLYESELIRAAVNTIATHCSKLNVVIQGSAKPALRVKLQHAPNEYQTWSQFFYRLATILNIQNSAFIAPVFDDYGQISGIFSLLPSECDIVDYDGVEYLRYHFGRGQAAAVELENCGIMTTRQYKDDMFGDSNRALKHTADLIEIINQGIEEGVKSSASYRFMAKSTNWSKDSDLAKERERFTSAYFGKGS